MKNLAITVIGLAAIAVNGLRAANTTAPGSLDHPRGSFLELHSCEVYAGGCVVSSEAPQGGRYMVRVWNFTGGSEGNVDLSGLQVAVLQLSPDNLATPDSQPGQAVIYLPAAATAGQRAALRSWLKRTQPELERGTLHTRVVPMRLAQAQTTAAFTAGEFLSLNVRTMESCDTGSCGEALWYKPRTPCSLFTVGFNRSSQVREPLLELTWIDGGKRSAFLARFGQSRARPGVYVSLNDFCNPAERLF